MTDKETYTIVEKAGLNLMFDQYQLLLQLNPALEINNYKQMLTAMCSQNYNMLCVFDKQKSVAISGYWMGTKIYCGKYLEPDNVIVDAAYRSKGIGKLMCDALTKIARENDCKVMMLDAYLSNKAGHAFYEREGFEKKGYHFIKTL